jgi:hypothetical protein
MIKEDQKKHFSYDLEESLTPEERKANEKLQQIISLISQPKDDIILKNFYETKPIIEKSKLYEVLEKMPKGAIHHLHTTASPPIDTYLKFILNDPTCFYNDRERILKIFPDW